MDVIVAMKQLTLIFLFFLVTCLNAQDGTTFILIRHAEKAQDDPIDPTLGELGIKRAALLADVLENMPVDVIYSTNYKRTLQTVQPLAEQKGIDIMSYVPLSFDELAKSWIEKHKGQTVVVSGHSNTTPFLANALLGTAALSEFDESDYGNLLIIFIDSSGKGRLLHLRF